MPGVPTLARFRRLVDDISRLYAGARGAQVRFAWETGRRIVEEEQDGAMRAAYGSALVPRLSEALTAQNGPGFSVNTLRKMRQFYLLRPIQPISVELDWSDYLELLPVKDKTTRNRLEARVIKEGLKTIQIRRMVRRIRESETRKKALSSPVKSLPPLKRPSGLKLHTFSLSPLRVKLKDDQVLIDCGFFVSWPVAKEELKGLDITAEMSYTYAAAIDRVIDGDTLLALIQVGFGIIVRDRLRLRGIDTAEMGTPEGDRARKFVEKLLPVGSAVVIKSHKSKTDAYGRFVADVFYKAGVADAAEILADGMHLNQDLLDQGHAVRMGES